mmetsp:Transcript_15047/g.50956  ORF Transcript_15047/g.50956 Transcript_15047/m.50956 type:complete len:355 (-) Transcript_15047:13-1077(-)
MAYPGNLPQHFPERPQHRSPSARQRTPNDHGVPRQPFVRRDPHVPRALLRRRRGGPRPPGARGATAGPRAGVGERPGRRGRFRGGGAEPAQHLLRVGAQVPQLHRAVRLPPRPPRDPHVRRGLRGAPGAGQDDHCPGAHGVALAGARGLRQSPGDAGVPQHGGRGPRGRGDGRAGRGPDEHVRGRAHAAAQAHRVHHAAVDRLEGRLAPGGRDAPRSAAPRGLPRGAAARGPRGGPDAAGAGRGGRSQAAARGPRDAHDRTALLHYGPRARQPHRRRRLRARRAQRRVRVRGEGGGDWRLPRPALTRRAPPSPQRAQPGARGLVSPPWCPVRLGHAAVPSAPVAPSDEWIKELW